MDIVIAGMHRSGTSAIARMLVEQGAFPGDPSDLVPAKQDNRRGFFERKDVLHLHEEVLEALGCSWDAVSRPDLDALDSRRDEFRDRFREIRDRFSHEPTRLWKDPRFSLLLPLWLDLLESPVLVVPLRHPASVAASLARRNQISTSRAEALWEIYNCSAVGMVSRLPVCVLSFEDAIARPQSAARFLADRLAQHGAQLSRGDEAASKLEPSLVNHNSDQVECDSPWVRETWSRLQEFAEGPSTGLVPEPSDRARMLLDDFIAERQRTLAARRDAGYLHSQVQLGQRFERGLREVAEINLQSREEVGNRISSLKLELDSLRHLQEELRHQLGEPEGVLNSGLRTMLEALRTELRESLTAEQEAAVLRRDLELSRFKCGELEKLVSTLRMETAAAEEMFENRINDERKRRKASEERMRLERQSREDSEERMRVERRSRKESEERVLAERQSRRELEDRLLAERQNRKASEDRLRVERQSRQGLEDKLRKESSRRQDLKSLYEEQREQAEQLRAKVRDAKAESAELKVRLCELRQQAGETYRVLKLLESSLPVRAARRVNRWIGRSPN